jgi:acyl-CoA thioester hydrolase
MYESVETYRGFVYPSVIDHVGHMNVQSYTARFDEASWQFLARLGLSPAAMKTHDRSFVAVKQQVEYKREVLCASLLHIMTELVDIGRSTIRLVHHMFDSETNIEVATTEMIAVHFDLKRRLSVPLPQEVAVKAAALRSPGFSHNALALGLEPVGADGR